MSTSTEAVRDWWNKNPFAFGVSNTEGDQVGTIPPERMDKAYFDEVERRFRKHHRLAAQKDGAPVLSNLIDYHTLPGKKVLDIATGSGFIAVSLAAAGAHVTALDLTPFAVEHARRNFAVRGLTGTVVEGDAQRMTFPNETFDSVVAWGCLMHMPDTVGAVREMCRVTKKGGTALAYLYNRSSWPFWFNIIFVRGVVMLGLVRSGGNITKLTSRYSDGYTRGGNMLTKFYTPREVEQFFKSAGYSKVDSRPWHIPHEPDHWPARSFPVFKYLPPRVKSFMTRFGYGLIVTATK